MAIYSLFRLSVKYVTGEETMPLIERRRDSGQGLVAHAHLCSGVSSCLGVTGRIKFPWE